jgi:excinuclease UvrABC helicase subunit UvrB
MQKRADINNFIESRRILAKDPMLEEVDSIIVAHAMSSSECKYLLTFDKKFALNPLFVGGFLFRFYLSSSHL